jgi:hypothetical protein
MELSTILADEFSAEEKQIFLTNFRCYLEYDEYKDFVIDLDNVMHWIGFTRKDNLKRLVSKHFTEGTNYTLFLPAEEQGIVLPHGGNRKEKIMLTPYTFKELCIVAHTEKARTIRGYYLV